MVTLAASRRDQKHLAIGHSEEFGAGQVVEARRRPLRANGARVAVAQVGARGRVRPAKLAADVQVGAAAKVRAAVRVCCSRFDHLLAAC